MQENFSSTKFPTVASSQGAGGKGTPASPWTDYNNIKVDDSAYAWWGAFEPGQASTITGSSFDFPSIPASAVIDGIKVTISGSLFAGSSTVSLNIPGTTLKSGGALNGDIGGATDLWGSTLIDPSLIAGLSVSVTADDGVSGDASATMEYMSVTVYWHIESTTAPADVPTRVAYKVYSREGNYLGELPEVQTRLSIPQDINSAGSAIEITCAKDLRNITQVDPLQTEDGLDILTEDDHTIYAEITDLLVTTGASPDEALFKNSNRIKVFLYNYWHPNGKLMFSGQVNRITFSYGGTTDYVTLRAFSDGYDLAHYIARGYPFNYTNDQVQTTESTYATVSTNQYGHWERYGQSFTTGVGVTNVGAIALLIMGTADVTVDLYDNAPNGNLLGSITKSVANAAGAIVQFEFASLVDVPASDIQFFTVKVGTNQSIRLYYNPAAPYAGGTMYRSTYAGGSGGGGYTPFTGDLYFVTKSGLPTTTTTYNNSDPITTTMANILLDYNNRGGYVKKRDFTAAGLLLTYTFNMATIYDVMKKVIELSPQGYYAYVDVGTAEMDIQATSTTPDFTVVRGNDLSKLDISLTIEGVKNYLLFTGGETAGVNLYRDYPDQASQAFYGIRTVPMSDNRVTVAATANALGQSFLAENAGESHETQITVLDKNIDITLLTPGKTIGFKNFGNFIDNMVLQIVRREYTPGYATLTLGRLPLTLSAEVQRINRELVNEQTAKNPATPS